MQIIKLQNMNFTHLCVLHHHPFAHSFSKYLSSSELIINIYEAFQNDFERQINVGFDLVFMRSP